MRRFAGWAVVAAGLTGIIPATAWAAKPAPAEIKMAERLDALLNAGKAAEAAALFSPGAIAKAPDGRVLAGRDAIAGWLGSLAGFRADSGNRQAWEGGRVTWATSVSDDRLRALGIAPLAASAELIVTDGAVSSYALRYSAESRMKVAEATAKEIEALWRSSLTLDAVAPDLRAALPDLALAIDEVIVSPDRVAARGTLAGTWTGVYLGVTGTGQPLSAGFAATARIASGAVTDSSWLVDTRSLQDQMGFTVTHPALAPKPVAAPKPAPAARPAAASKRTPKRR